MPVLLLLHLLACCGVSAQTGGSPTQTLSRAGCACQPTLLSATSSSVTCYQANASAPFGCAVDPSDPCSDGVLGRTWDLCNIVDLYLVADQVASSTSSSSLNATLYGKQQVVLKKTQLSGVIFQRTVTKFTLALDNATQVESVKIEALVSTSLRIFEVQATLNDLPTTVFAPPSPGPISFVSSDDTAATGVVSLLFVPMTEYFDGDALGQCYFDLMVYNGTGQPSTVTPISVDKPDTNYSFRAQAINFVGAGDMSEEFYYMSGPLSRPGPPRFPAVPSSRTGGAISLDLLRPLDTGGYEDISYVIYYRENGSGKRFRTTYSHTKGLSITVFRLAANTIYDMVAVSVLENDTSRLTAGGLYGMRVYLGDRTEIGLLAKAEADRRFKPHRPKNRRQPKAKVAIADRVNAKITGFLQKIQKRNSKVLFGVEVNPPAPMFPVSPSKFKILIGFFQIFGNFQSSFVVKWSANIQNFMSFSQKFNLDLVAIANIDCVVAKTFYFNFMVTVSQVVAVLTVITAYFYAGMRSYRAKLHLIPRNCLRCGLPVFESEIVHNDDESFNPLLLLRSWWRTHNFYKRAVSATAGEDDAKENDNSAAFSVIKETRLLKRKFGMSQVRTPYLGLFRSVHSKCPVKGHVLSGVMLERTIRSNLRVWQARVKLRMNYLTYRNKCLKLYCWIALFLYPSVSKSILAIYNCQQVGETYYLVADRRLVCYNGQWAVFGIIATVGVVVWVVGIPFFFGLLIWLAQDRAIAARLKVLNKLPQMRVQREKWLKAVEQQQIADNRFVRNMEDTEVQNEELAKYMKRKNLTDSTVQARLGFIYAEYSIEYWWFEVVDLSRKLFLSGVIIFVENGSVEQVLLAIAVCLVTMWFLLYFQPYEGYSDNLMASVSQLQLFFTLWLGVMINLNNLNVESQINVDLLSVVLIGTCVAVTMFGLVLIVGEGLTESRRMRIETVAARKEQLQQEVRKRWVMAFNYAAFEAQLLRRGGQFSFTDLSAPAVLEAARRVRRIEEGEDPDAVAALANIQEGEEEASA
ncbi:uncharacterized protein IUM83_16126 [Phytophthora cinnamomi]|uniref:uncharacterized protein n=1 Tax=Phytophthora cinnamomi TaxID=4785 RepID=UPI00355A3FA0|nr:hypothetical protein IUM83_16126 [Phytophthora cinnamomi]